MGARGNCRFTLLFEQAAVILAREMPVLAAARIIGITDQRLWRIIEHYVGQAVAGLDLGRLKAVGLDETASKRGHNYVTVFIDLDAKQKPVVFVTPGKGKETVTAFKAFLEQHGGKPGRILEVVCDMSPAFLAAIGETFEQANVTVDWFHVVQLRASRGHRPVHRNGVAADDAVQRVHRSRSRGRHRVQTIGLPKRRFAILLPRWAWRRRPRYRGNPHAEYNIGVMYDLGTGIEQDRAKAVIWYRKAANQGHEKAQFNLGFLYANGDGVSQELVLAYKWLELAAIQGHPEAEEQRDAVGELLTPEQLAGARKLLEQWIETYTK